MPRSSSDWEKIIMTRANTLVQGTKSDLDACVLALTPFCPTPVVTPEDPIGTALAAIDKGSVILENVSRFTLEEQREILSWLDLQGCGVRLIATTTERLYDLVEGGRFVDTLYYRLNVIFIDLASDSVFSMFTSFFSG
jgi:hypothetical protein